MSVKTLKVAYGDPKQGLTDLPRLTATLSLHGQSVTTEGLVDSGASCNVLPFHLGLQLGADWDQQTMQIPLAGNLGTAEARGIVLPVQIGDFAPIPLAFAWTRLADAPLIFGQMNFFMEFDVCFFRSRSMFEVKPKGQ